MLMFTNRVIDPAQSSEAAFSRRYEALGETLGFASVTGTVTPQGATWQVSDPRVAASDDQALAALVPVFSGAKPVLVYIHGNNNTPATAFRRCQTLQKLYACEVVGFSWTSEGFQADGTDLSGLSGASDTGAGDDSLEDVRKENKGEGRIQRKIRHYLQAKANAQASARALARFLRLLSVARQYAHQREMTVVAHSLGCHFLQKTLELPGAQAALAAATNVVLVSACARSAQHQEWVGKINPSGQVFITTNQGDSVLAAASFVDNDEIKLGTSAGADFLHAAKVRYIDFSGGSDGFGGHGYFVGSGDAGPKPAALKLFSLLFASKRDFAPGTDPVAAYPLRCNADQSMCFMSTPVVHEG